MIRLTLAAAICGFTLSLAGVASAVPVSESTVDEACGDQIEGGCSGRNLCDRLSKDGEWQAVRLRLHISEQAGQNEGHLPQDPGGSNCSRQ
jgi:hypothetical protein